MPEPDALDTFKGDLPPETTYGTVAGEVGAFVADGSDPGVLPDVVTRAGTITFTPTIAFVTDRAHPERLWYAQPVTVPVAPDGTFTVTLVACESPNLSPTGWGYDVVLEIPGRKTLTSRVVVAGGTTTGIGAVLSRHPQPGAIVQYVPGPPGHTPVLTWDGARLVVDGAPGPDLAAAATAEAQRLASLASTAAANAEALAQQAAQLAQQAAADAKWSPSADAAAAAASAQAAREAADEARAAATVTDQGVAQLVQTGEQTSAAVSAAITRTTDDRYAKAASLAKVATSGAYADLTGTPSLSNVATTGAYTDLAGAPKLAKIATSGAYGDLTGAPALAKVATSGAWADVQGKPRWTGTGAPASSLGAVGDTYIDTAATGGALRWVKWPAGWAVDVGDTGRRDISSTLNDPYKGASMPSLFVARTGNIVTMTAVNIQLTAAGSAGQTIATLPAGFRPETPSTPAGNANNTFRLTTGGVLATSYAYGSGVVFSLTSVYRTIEAWPA